ncbi:AB-hydrolase YheT [Sparassis latifolia]|uniref:AB-hydrolase YheT n=1 Tax=Sparassis crispa TaxID=139825 RepID=A0A401GFT4_9APHY|nr:AB-hydrolase YheT [Sparassis crispa]GBE81054.1 AB-hydrolase YheT [Sparassis crispa]
MGLLFSVLLPAGYYLPKLYFHSPRPSLSVRTSLGSKEVQRISLRSFVESKCPSLYTEFRPAWWLYSGHLQTGYSVVGDFSKVDKVEYDRTFLRTLDGGTIGVDFTPSGDQDLLKDDTPIVVALHGLTGGSHEAYVRTILAPVCAPVKQGGLGYRGVVVNFRGCAGVPITSPQLYSAGHTEDVRVAVMYIARKYPKAPLIGLGFSLGANVMTRYLAEEGQNSRLVAGCVLACSWDLVKNGIALDGHFLNHVVYSKAMGTNLQKLVKRHEASLSKFSDHPVGKAVPKVLSLKTPALIDFDENMTRLAGGSSPPFPFPSAHEYYVWASSHDVLGRIRVPFLAISSEDDPIVQVLPVDTGENEWVVFAVTKKGGHLGWFEAGSSFGEVQRWIRKPVVEWIRAVGQDLVMSRQGKPLHVVDGFLKEVGRDDIGCMEIGGREHVVGVAGEEGLLAGL